MSDSKLDQLVKGAPPPNTSPTQLAQSAKNPPSPSNPITTPHPPTHPTDPRDNLPSSPPQIYLNLLILESSLRLQYLSLRARLRLHLLLLTALTTWILTFTYLLFFRPREDGSGVGGSVYWVLETTYKLAWGGGVVTACLFYFTGLYDRGVRWPRRFVGTTNRGLRQFNLKVITLRGSFLRELLSQFSAGWRGESARVDFQLLPKSLSAEPAKTLSGDWSALAQKYGVVEEDIAPAGDVLKVLLLPKPFSPDFREGWEVWRAGYWERENARRADLRRCVKARRREVAKREGGWLWWVGWRGWGNFGVLGSSRKGDLEWVGMRERAAGLGELREKRRREGLVRGESHSRSSSRASTPGTEGRGDTERRSGSSTSSAGAARSGSTARRHRKPGSLSSRLSASDVAPEAPSPLAKRPSTLSSASSTGSEDVKKERESGSESPEPTRPLIADEIKQEPEET